MLSLNTIHLLTKHMYSSSDGKNDFILTCFKYEKSIFPIGATFIKLLKSKLNNYIFSYYIIKIEKNKIWFFYNFILYTIE